MANSIVKYNVQDLVDQWLEAERGGEEFPVPLHEYWDIAGHKKKQDIVLLAESLLQEGFDYLRQDVKNTNGRGRPAKGLFLTTAALEHICLAAHTEQGRIVRELYRQSKRKWDLVQQNFPGVAQEIEILHLKAEIAKQEAIKAQADEKSLSLRHYVATALPEAVQKKIFGYTEIPIIEYRDRVIHNDDLINDGSTILKKDLCQRYGFFTRNGHPDYKTLNRYLDKMPPDAFQLSVRIQDNNELLRSAVPKLDEMIHSSDRQRYIGE